MSARILIIDDATTVRMYHRKVLSDAGWRVDEAGNGIEALEKLMNAHREEDDYDLYVVDVNMPKMDGYSFVRELRRLDGVAQTPVLMVSTEAQAHDSERAREAGVNFYIVKPAKPAGLVLTAALMLGDLPVADAAAQLAVAESAGKGAGA